MNNKKENFSYQKLANKPMPCSFCGASINGSVREKKDPKTKEIVKECHWVCCRCGNVSRVGVLAD